MSANSLRVYGNAVFRVGVLCSAFVMLGADVFVSAWGAEAREIRIVSGTYGGNCGAPQSNATRDLARRCDGRMTCRYVVDQPPAVPLQAACKADFQAAWKCNHTERHVAALSPEATPGSTLVLSCVRPTGAGK
ncbi:hypothetical protein FAZ69_31460 [Trinickia terrae]|uniref:Uncharacterized protein n=1 Tax=Trinickia terrae TaxID=2571161 RepID=A0A4U1HDG6_9BURK|nr:hypothetical protein [Trinickia terrae]TKC78959.1 hypothetical protein FAZ69_31460 [Trinickia terrae]